MNKMMSGKTQDESISAGSSSMDVTNSTGTDRLGSSDRSVNSAGAIQIRRTKHCFGLVVLLCGIAVSITIYYFIVKNDYERFSVEYSAYVQNVKELVQWEVVYNFALMQQLSATITATVLSSGGSFPNYTIPFFEISSGYVDGMGGIMATAYAPLLPATSRLEWEEYSVANQGWLKDSEILKAQHPGHRDPLHNTMQDHEHDRRRLQLGQHPPITDKIFRWEDGVKIVENDGVEGEIFAPLWQVSPPDSTPVNMNLFSDPRLSTMFAVAASTNQTIQSGTMEIGDMFDFCFDANEKDRKTNGHMLIMEPVYDKFSDDHKIVGIIVAVTALDNLLSRTLPEGVEGITAVFEDSCGDVRTYEIDAEGRLAKQVAKGDVHDPDYNNYMESFVIKEYDDVVDGLCIHTLKLYPSNVLRQRYDSKRSALYKCIAVAGSFAALLLMVGIYDRQITARQNAAIRSAKKSGELINSMFPKNVRDRILDGGDIGNDTDDGEANEKSAPIADFFPSATLMFADIAGFTAWSSTREPFQVFELLETLYSEFDSIARKRRVFKVETVGDCYVAAVGLPASRKDHAVVMARFARECLHKVNELLPILEISLGPETSNLSFRVGLHSGPVTAGVLRGNNARYQIFGDTVNTAARMETTGIPNRIHVSSCTAELIVKAGKGHWVHPREETVFAKGKGEMNTYWLVVENEKGGADETTTCSSIVDFDEDILTAEVSKAIDDVKGLSSKMLRLVDWNADILFRLLKQVVSKRRKPILCAGPDQWSRVARQGDTVLSEVQEIISLPGFEKAEKTSSPVPLDDQIQQQLRDYVATIATHYPPNPFHNFEHASHVSLSVVKMMSRIISPADVEDESQLHELTYGITSDPLIQFSVVFAALIHDVDHPGVPNGQLSKENSELAAKYHGKSIAEQRSVDLSWAILLSPKYSELREAICSTEGEISRFRQLVVNSVMATDVMDKGLKELRNQRWNKAFSEQPLEERHHLDPTNRKATIVIEHLIQASDISHTMQHWHVYRKWNANLFSEMYKAFVEGRSNTDPIQNWYQGEMNFFDFYVIPLAKKLHECGVFGVSSHEYLSYAETNRNEWHQKGKAIVEELAAKVRKEHKRETNRKLRRLSSSGMQKQSSTRMLRRLSSSGMQKQPSTRTLTREPSLRARPGALSRASRTASMRSLMEKVWQNTDALDGPTEPNHGNEQVDVESQIASHDIGRSPPSTASSPSIGSDAKKPPKRTLSGEILRFT